MMGFPPTQLSPHFIVSQYLIGGILSQRIAAMNIDSLERGTRAIDHRDSGAIRTSRLAAG